MQEITKDCSRAEELVAYLYGEAAPREAADFRAHAESCASCRTELAAFGGVREAIGEWRELSLGSIATPASEARTALRRDAAASAANGRRRSALAALREFFTLSPVWMRAGVAATALIFCALSFIAFKYFTRQPEVVVMQTPQRAAEATAENNGVKVPAGTPAVNPESAPASTPKATIIAANKPQQPRRVERRRSVPEQQQQLANGRKRVRPRNLAEPSLELASADDYLPFTRSSTEDKLPSLADLVNDEN